jgi:predicted Zn-dependent protease
VVARVSIAVVAFVVAAWLGLGLYQSQNQERVQPLLHLIPVSPGYARHARQLLRRAGTLNPDPEPEIERGAVALLAHDPAQAERILLGVVSREPDNIKAWTLLGNAARSKHNGALLARALAGIRRLNPPR